MVRGLLNKLNQNYATKTRLIGPEPIGSCGLVQYFFKSFLFHRVVKEDAKAQAC